MNVALQATAAAGTATTTGEAEAVLRTTAGRDDPTTGVGTTNDDLAPTTTARQPGTTPRDEAATRPRGRAGAGPGAPEDVLDRDPARETAGDAAEAAAETGSAPWT